MRASLSAAGYVQGEFRKYLARAGCVEGVEFQVVTAGTVIDLEKLERSGRQVVQEDPRSGFGWRVLSTHS